MKMSNIPWDKIVLQQFLSCYLISSYTYRMLLQTMDILHDANANKIHTVSYRLFVSYHCNIRFNAPIPIFSNVLNNHPCHNISFKCICPCQSPTNNVTFDKEPLVKFRFLILLLKVVLWLLKVFVNWLTQIFFSSIFQITFSSFPAFRWIFFNISSRYFLKTEKFNPLVF